VIFRVVAKLYENWQFSYTDFQFKIASRWDWNLNSSNSQKQRSLINIFETNFICI
jgi:hypothetical protein